MDALVVSEDPEFIAEVQTFLRARGSRAKACLGPISTPCLLETEGRCPLAENSQVIIVDAPSGAFSHLSDSKPAGPYAGRLREACPHSLVVLEAPDLQAGPTGGTAHISSREDAFRLLDALFHGQSESERRDQARL